MRGRAQLITIILVAVAATALLVAWTAGLLDLGDGDGPAVLVEHRWRAAGTAGEPEVHQADLPFKVPKGTDRLRLSYLVDLPSGIAVGLPGSVEDPSPEVRLELRDGGGEVVWSDSLYASARSAEDIDVTAPGGWTLSVWMRGYGYEGETGLGTPVELHDSVAVTVSAP